MLHERRILAATFGGRRWSVSRGLAWELGGLTHFWMFFFLVGSDLLFCMYRKKIVQNWVGPPRPKRYLGTDHLRPSNLAAKTLSFVEHTLSKFGDPCPVRRGLAAAVKCYVRKARFFRCC